MKSRPIRTDAYDRKYRDVYNNQAQYYYDELRFSDIIRPYAKQVKNDLTINILREKTVSGNNKNSRHSDWHRQDSSRTR